jgi:hypothetical protein
VDAGLIEKSSDAKVAVTESAAFKVRMHELVLEQAPLQPANVEGEFGVAVRVTEVPGVKLAEQEFPCSGENPHSMPGGLLVTVPLPFPAMVTERISFEVPAEPLITVTLPLTVFAV